MTGESRSLICTVEDILRMGAAAMRAWTEGCEAHGLWLRVADEVEASADSGCSPATREDAVRAVRVFMGERQPVEVLA